MQAPQGGREERRERRTQGRGKGEERRRGREREAQKGEEEERRQVAQERNGEVQEEVGEQGWQLAVACWLEEGPEWLGAAGQKNGVEGN